MRIMELLHRWPVAALRVISTEDLQEEGYSWPGSSMLNSALQKRSIRSRRTASSSWMSVRRPCTYSEVVSGGVKQSLSLRRSERLGWKTLLSRVLSSLPSAEAASSPMTDQKAALMSAPESRPRAALWRATCVGAERLNSSRLRSTPLARPEETRDGCTPIGPKERWNWRVARPALSVALRCLAGCTNCLAARPALIILEGCRAPESANLSRPTPAETLAGCTPIGPKERWNWRVARPALSVAPRCLAGWTNWRAASPALIMRAGARAPDRENFSKLTPAATLVGWTPMGPKVR
mmetsp:Transcript_66098/g.204576  ORF Transcript_66098/g.204576 Transcript_66098/m.204576 type:complete len:294 (-) Transcript_66098:703-1584(-)